ncbi:LacI family DNA-binding transcriptional regulator [Silvibacterium sp.]|uniref:LacI family DNA-binding transcriptional regulator n=1 Tax=Silvibacterium sp. TaxID=1964179 RepID=UPI0039E509BD
MPRKRKAASKEKRPDIREVATAAGVSLATVSRVLNNVSTVDEKLRKRVLAVTEKLRYVPNRQASSLVSGRSRLFGVIISDITNPFFPELIQGFEARAVEIGYEALIGSTNYDPKSMELCVERMLSRNVDGVAVMTFGIETPLLERFAAQRIPMVFIDEAPARQLTAAIKVDYDHGIQQAIQHLAVLGHRRIGFISGPKDLRSAQSRLEAFKKSMGALGIKLSAEMVVEGNYTIESGQIGFQAFQRLTTPPSAIICSNDMTAIGVMHAAFDAELSIPRDLSVIGFDDISLSRHLLPPLTTVRMSCNEIGSRAVDSLHALVEDRSRAAINSALLTSLVVRQRTDIRQGALADLPGKKAKRI